MYRIDWGSLKDFVVVAEAGSLSSAARRLGVSQPTVGRRIDQLEKQLNAALFSRTPRGLVLTETGEQILERARRVEEEALAIERMAAGANQQLEGTVRISLTEDLGTWWLPDKLAKFHAQYPALRIEANLNNRMVNLVRREADIAIRLSRPQQPDLIARKVAVLAYGLYASHTYLARHGEPSGWRDLRHHYHVGFEHAIADMPAIERMERFFGADRIRHRSNNYPAQLEATAAGLGIGAHCRFQANRDERIQRVLRDVADHRRDVWLLTHTDMRRSARIRAVYDFLAEALNNDRALLADEDLGDDQR